MKFGLLTQWYDPEPGPAALPGVLARGLVSKGHEVHVLTGIPNYPSGRIAPGYRAYRPTRETEQGVHIHRVPLYPSHDSSAIHRVANYASFGVTSFFAAPRVFAEMDAIWVNYSPVTVAPAQWATRYFRSVPGVVHVLDLWPDTVAASGRAEGGPRGSMVAGIDWWCRRMYAAAHSVAYIAPGVGPVLIGRGVSAEKLAYVPMWADESTFFPSQRSWRAKLSISDETTVLLYAGALGAAQQIDSLVEACRALPQDGSFLALIAGSGTEEQSLRALATRSRLTNMRFLGRVPQSDMTELMATADLCYVSLNDHPHARITLPSKTQATFAAGKAVLCNARGDVADVIREADAGWICPSADPSDIAGTLRLALSAGKQETVRRGAQARGYYLERFSADVGVGRVEALLEAAAYSRRRQARPRAQPLPPPSSAATTEALGVTYRPLRGTDVHQAARLHLRAFPDFFLSQLGERFLIEFYRGFLDDHSALTVLAETPGGRVAGVCVGTNEPNGFYSRLLRRRLLPLALASAQASFRNPRAIPRLLGGARYRGDADGSPDGALLASICVDPDAPVGGIGRELIGRWCRLAASRTGSAYLTTDARDNDRVNRFYVQAGWQVTATFTTPQGRPMHRYERSLT